MDIRQLELFIAAAEERHFSRAAARENIVQSGLSVAIRALEDELGVALFVRTTRHVDLSEAGRILLPEARRVIAAMRSARSSVASVKEGLGGRVSISVVPSLASYLDIADLAFEFHHLHPQVDFRIQESVEEFARRLRDGQLDLAFMPVFGAVHRDLIVDVLVSEPMVAILPPTHPLVGETEIDLMHLDGAAFVDVSERWHTRGMVDRIFLANQASRKTIIETENIPLLYKFVAAGFGVTLLPFTLARNSGLPVTKIRRLKNQSALPAWELGLFRRRIDEQLVVNAAADSLRAMIYERMQFSID